ncbi:hypothetical protein DL769_005626 [Monosporascus sp. CRB-8-3]|nr:hypothetical protein DL769_005626 [Monosporascus sp. CRB-8-3]
MDIEAMIESGQAIPLRYRGSADRIVKSDAFRNWATSARSCELFIQGDAVADTVQAGVAMSLVSASIMQGYAGERGSSTSCSSAADTSSTTMRSPGATP